MSVRIFRGPDALEQAAPVLDELHDRIHTALTARRPWLACWAGVYGHRWEPWIVTVQRAGVTIAAAPLARRGSAAIIRVIPLGGKDPDQTPLVAVDDRAAGELAGAVRASLARLHRPWSLFLPRLDHALLGAFRVRFPTTEVDPEAATRAVLVLAGQATPPLSRNTRSSVARHRNRIARDGLTLEIEVVHDPVAVLDLLPEVLAVHHQRDVQLRGGSQLDDPAVTRLYRSIIEQHRLQCEILTVRLEGELAAYDLCLRDGNRLFVMDNRMNPAFARYAPGLLANAETVRRAAADPTIGVLDWGTGLQRYKTSNANAVDSTGNLTAWSSPTCARVLAVRRRVQEQWQARRGLDRSV